eukprot:4374702-Amphidinium_carterae.1
MRCGQRRSRSTTAQRGCGEAAKPRVTVTAGHIQVTVSPHNNIASYAEQRREKYCRFVNPACSSMTQSIQRSRL